MIELRLNNGFLEYRYRYPQYEMPVNTYPPEGWKWSEWKEVETSDGKQFQVCIIEKK